MRAPELEGMMLGYVLSLGADRARTWNDQQAAIDVSGLREELLFDPRVRIGWGILTRLVGRRVKVDSTVLFSAAKSANWLDEHDLDWLISIENTHGLTGEKFNTLTEDHRRRARGREIAGWLERAAQEIRERGLRPAELQGQLENIGQQLVREWAPDEQPELDVAEVLDDWDRRLRGETVGGALVVPTGIKIVDEVVKGFVPGLNMILGDPGIGKSAVIGSIIEAQLDAGLTVGLFGLEEGYRWLTKRLIARDLGMSVGDVGIAQRTVEQESKLPEVGQRLFELYKGRLLVYRHDGVSIDALCQRAATWILQKNCQAIYIDHIGEIQHGRVRDGDGYNWAVAQSYRRLRDLGNKRSVPIVAIAHRKPDARERQGPPKANDVGLTGEAEKMVRRMLGLWRKNQSMRLTVIKNNEGKTDETVELERLYDSALVGRDGGRKISLEAEEREEKAKKRELDREKRYTDSRWLAERKKADKPAAPAPAEAAAVAPPAPQATLLEVPQSKKPEPTT
jgi:hypothetical protein